MADQLPLIDEQSEVGSPVSKIEAERKKLLQKNKQLKKYNDVLQRLAKALKEKGDSLLPLFYSLKKFSDVEKALISPEIQEVVSQEKAKIDGRLIEFQDFFSKEFITAVRENKQKLTLEAKLIRFPKFIINNRMTVDFRFSESISKIDDCLVVPSVSATETAAAACSYYKEIWSSNPEIRNLKEGINKFFEAYKTACMSVGKSIGEDVSVFELYKFINIDSQFASFWKDAKREMFKPFPMDHFKPVLSSLLSGSFSTKAGYKIRFTPVRDTERNALHVFSPIENAFVFIGLVKFVREAA